MVAGLPRSVSPISHAHLRLLDQRLLPESEVYLDCTQVEQVISAIKQLSVRGAPAIGLAAAFGLLLEIDQYPDSKAEIATRLGEVGAKLVASRPTAVNLAWAVEAMLAFASTDAAGLGAAGWRDRLFAKATELYDADRAACRKIGAAGAALVSTHPRVLTHCNAGALAVSEFGTALAPIYHAHNQGVEVSVWVDETRPLLQGSRLTAFELMAHQVPCRLITDSMAAHVMASGLVDMVLVGADRVAANGDTANKIGTLGVAVLANHYGLPVYVACPWSTIDLNTASGSDIEIELRNPDEVRTFQGQPSAPTAVPVYNPAFDVTPGHLISGFITEQGLIAGPFDETLKVAASHG